jgi:hypothetical protein
VKHLPIFTQCDILAVGIDENSHNRCDERLKPKDDESTCLTYTGLLEELEYLKIETRLVDENPHLK